MKKKQVTMQSTELNKLLDEIESIISQIACCDACKNNHAKNSKYTRLQLEQLFREKLQQARFLKKAS